MRAQATFACALALLPAAGCGGGGGGGTGPADARKVISEFATAVNARDGATLCEELTTRDYIERTTAATGDAAVRQCKSQIASLEPTGRYRVIRFVSTKIDGDKATVIADLDTAGQRRRTILRLVRQDGTFRLTSGTAGR